MIELENWKEEKQSAYLYRAVSDAESGSPRQLLFLELAAAAEKQAEIWAAAAQRKGFSVPERFRPSPRARLVAWLVARLGPRALKDVLAAMKVRGMSLYTKNVPGHSAAAENQRHRGSAGDGILRAAVFGINDGLVSNASLILGVAAATRESGLILLSGVAGLLAGAFSMAAGEYVSMRAQREMFEYQIGLERDELAQYPEEEADELALIFEARGVARDEAQNMARSLIGDPDRALDTLTREELGLNPDELGSPWGAAGASFLAFSLGAAIPLLPFLFGSGGRVLATSATLTGVALFATGALISLFTGRHALQGGLRMLAIGAAAGTATFFAGRLVGVLA
jgi:VIT1/CCC1 family predicted Fe2+/Mn2+ transporter